MNANVTHLTAKAVRTRTTGQIFELKVTLREVTPPVWRRLQVPGNVKLSKLHHLLQAVMGWTNSHLHEFRVGKRHIGEPEVYDMAFEDDPEVEDERDIRLQDIADAGARFEYLYDFGDGWSHEVEVEAVFKRGVGAKLPHFLDGSRACPPEDCGGPGGYEELKEALGDPDHERHDELAEWIGDRLAPEALDVLGIQRSLARVR